jgi:LacI family gluconate utilization system Gnt-I transcriptional repressor
LLIFRNKTGRLFSVNFMAVAAWVCYVTVTLHDWIKLMSQKPRRPTLQDVADLVGITKMTVSRYLKDPALVSAAVQEKIAVALDTLGYIPNRAPDLLSNAKSKAIGVLLPSLTNQVFAEVIRGIESVTEPAGYQTMLAHYGYGLIR